MKCPRCDSASVIKNGTVHTGKQKYACKVCDRQFVENPTKKTISQEEWELVDRLLPEKLPIAGISRATGIPEPWLRKYVNRKYEKLPKKIETVKIRPIDDSPPTKKYCRLKDTRPSGRKAEKPTISNVSTLH